jgi:hypothetical protein
VLRGGAAALRRLAEGPPRAAARCRAPTATRPPPRPATRPATLPQVLEEERHHNEHGMETLVCDSVSAAVAAVLIARDAEGRAAFANTFGRLFEGLSDIAKAVLIILIADTLLGWVGALAGGRRAATPLAAERTKRRLAPTAAAADAPAAPPPPPRRPAARRSYHSEEGWTGLIDVVLGHYGIEVQEKDIVLFVGIIPIAIDVAFKVRGPGRRVSGASAAWRGLRGRARRPVRGSRLLCRALSRSAGAFFTVSGPAAASSPETQYWIFIGLNKISPGAVVTIKQLDRH